MSLITRRANTNAIAAKRANGEVLVGEIIYDTTQVDSKRNPVINTGVSNENQYSPIYKGDAFPRYKIGEIIEAYDYPVYESTAHGTGIGQSNYSIKYMNGYWFKLGNVTEYSASPFGPWITLNKGFSSTTYDIVYRNGVWVLGYNSGYIGYCTSLTGVWTTIKVFAGTSAVNTVDYGNGYWVAAGGAGNLVYATSLSGPWTAVTLLDTSSATYTQGINRVLYVNDYWVICGDKTYIAYAATTPISWTCTKYNSTGYSLRDIAYNNGTWVIPESIAGNLYFYSFTDPTATIAYNIMTIKSPRIYWSGTGYEFNSIEYANGYWVMTSAAPAYVDADRGSGGHRSRGMYFAYTKDLNGSWRIGETPSNIQANSNNSYGNFGLKSMRYGDGYWVAYSPGYYCVYDTHNNMTLNPFVEPCDGQNVPISAYPELYASIDNRFSPVSEPLAKNGAMLSKDVGLVGSAQKAIWSANSTYLTVGHSTAPFMSIYKLNYTANAQARSFTKIANPATLPPNTMNDAAWSPDGRYLAIGHNSSPFLTIYDWVTGSPVKIANPATLPPNSVNGVCWSPDGRYLAVGCAASSPYFRIYDWVTGSPVAITNPTGIVAAAQNDCAWSPDGRYLAFCNSTTSPFLTIFDWSTGVPVKIANPATLPASSVMALEWTPDSRTLICCSISSPFLIFYNFDTGVPVPLPITTLPPAAIKDISLTADGRYLLGVYNTTTSNTILYDLITDAVNLTPTNTITASNTVNYATFSKDGKYIALSTPGTVQGNLEIYSTEVTSSNTTFYLPKLNDIYQGPEDTQKSKYYIKVKDVRTTP